MQIQPGAVELFRHRQGLRSGCQELRAALFSNQIPAQVARHGGKFRACCHERIDVFCGPVPNFHEESLIRDRLDPLLERQVLVDHLCACCEFKSHG